VRASPLRIVGACCAFITITGLASAPAFAAQAAPAHAKLTADQIVRKANADFRSASSVRIYESASLLGMGFSASELLTRQGCLASVDVSGLSITVLQVGSQAWIKPSNQFWQELGYTSAQLAGLEGKWVTESALESALGGGGSGTVGVSTSNGDCDIQSSSNGIAAKNWTLDKTLQLSHQWAWRLSSTEVVDKQKLALDAYVSDARTPEWLRLTERIAIRVSKHSELSVSSTAYFSDYNAPATLTAPPAADVLTSIPTPPAGSGSGTLLSGSLALLSGSFAG
jgi:hypothetical protein